MVGAGVTTYSRRAAAVADLDKHVAWKNPGSVYSFCDEIRQWTESTLFNRSLACNECSLTNALAFTAYQGCGLLE